MADLHTVKPRTPFPMANERPKKVLPQINLDFDTLPEGKDWNVGSTYEIHLVVRQTGKRVERDGKGDVTFEISKAGGSSQRSKERFSRNPKRYGQTK